MQASPEPTVSVDKVTDFSKGIKESSKETVQAHRGLKTKARSRAKTKAAKKARRKNRNS